MRNVYIAGVGMTRFGKWLERNMKSLAAEAVSHALDDASLSKDEPTIAFVGNAAQGLITGQECVRGQVVLREMGIGGIPIVNVENACASSSTALHLAWQAVSGGFHDCALVLGMEKLYSEDKRKTFAAFGAAVDVEFLAVDQGDAEGAGEEGGRGERRRRRGRDRQVALDVHGLLRDGGARAHEAATERRRSSSPRSPRRTPFTAA